MTTIDRPVFIVGMPRSGSTAFHRVMARHPAFATTTHLTRKAPACYPALKLLSWFSHSHEPGEAGSMWDRFAGEDSDVMTGKEATPEARRYYTTAVSNVLRLYQKPRFLSKCPRNGMRMEFLRAIFPDARFIHLMRDGRAVCQSIMEQRRRSGSIDAWWDVKPAGWRQWEREPPVVAIAHQWDAVMTQMADTGRRMPAHQYLEVRYEDFAADPAAFIRKIAAFCEAPWADDGMAEAVKGIENRNDKWSKVFSTAEVAAMMAVMGATMKRYGYE
jgi:hypothetical protein